MAITDETTTSSDLRRRMMLCLPVIYFFIIFLVSFYSFKKPEYNWDMLTYMALVLKMDHVGSDSIYKTVYNTARNELPEMSYYQLTNPSNVYRKKMSESSDAFSLQLPFYIIKPLYIALCYALYKKGFSLTAATVLPSVISYAMIASVLLFWLLRYLSVLFASTLSLLIMLSPPLQELARLSTPDALSTFLLFSSFYFLLEKRNIIIIAMLMMAAVFARLDNILTCISVISLLAYSERPLKRNVTIRYTAIFLLLALSYFIVAANATQYGWSLFYYDTFSHFISSSHGFQPSFILRDHLQIMSANGMNGLRYSHIIIFFAMILSIFIGRPISTIKEFSFDQLFALLLLLIIIIRFILYPDVADRFYVSFYLIAPILIVRTLPAEKNLSFSQ